MRDRLIGFRRGVEIRVEEQRQKQQEDEQEEGSATGAPCGLRVLVHGVGLCVRVGGMLKFRSSDTKN